MSIFQYSEKMPGINFSSRRLNFHSTALRRTPHTHIIKNNLNLRFFNVFFFRFQCFQLPITDDDGNKKGK